MRRHYLLGAACVLGLTASAMAQRPGGTSPPTTPPPTTTPTTGGTAPKGPGTAPAGTPTTGGTAPTAPPTTPAGTPTTGGVAPKGTPTTGGTTPAGNPDAPPGTPTTGGTAPGTPGTVPPGTPTTGGPARPGTPTTGGTTVPPGTPTTGTVPGTAGTPGAAGTTGTAGNIGSAATVSSPFPSPLFQQTEVSRSLGLTERQGSELGRLTQTLQTRFASDFQGLSRLPAADQASRRQELLRQYQQDFVAASRDVFDASQLNRYQQLQLQSGGFNTLSDPAVQRQLALTEPQRRDLQSSIDWSSGQMREITALAATDRERATRLYADYQKTFQDRFNRFLTPEQTRTWQTLVGDPFAFPPVFPTAAPGTAVPGTTGGTTPAPGTTGAPPKQ